MPAMPLIPFDGMFTPHHTNQHQELPSLHFTLLHFITHSSSSSSTSIFNIVHHQHHPSPTPSITNTIHHQYHPSPTPSITNTIHHQHHPSPTPSITNTIHHQHHPPSSTHEVGCREERRRPCPEAETLLDGRPDCLTDHPTRAMIAKTPFRHRPSGGHVHGATSLTTARRFI
jgi:hypothetical protein